MENKLLSYEDAVNDVQSRTNDKEDPTLKNTTKALEQLGGPENDYRVVLVGGTNGKGSTVEILSELLQSEGQKVGAYKSPHLVSVRERIQINNTEVSEEEFLELYREIESLGLDLTFFEFMTVAAYLYFSKKDVDYAVMEVGMGGRMDATNAAKNEFSVITNVGLDHTEYLGDTREEIAAEKAGIIPENGEVVTPKKLNAIERKADEQNAETVRPLTVDEEEGRYSFRDQEFTLPLEGRFQRENLETALAAVERLEVIPEDIGRALGNLENPGRMETVQEDPLYIQDGAHNPDALKKAIKDLPEDFVCVFNAMKDKNSRKMVEILERQASKFVLTETDFRRAEKPENIAEHVSIDYEIVHEPHKAEKKALKEGKPVVATGSLYLIGQLKLTYES